MHIMPTHPLNGMNYGIPVPGYTHVTMTSSSQVLVIPAIFPSVQVTAGFGCNGKTPQTAVVSDGTLATVITALKANGIMS